MLPSFPLCRIILAEKRIAVVSELLAGKSQMILMRAQVMGIGSRRFRRGKKRITRRRVAG
jgi:hypothetical protein